MASKKILVDIMVVDKNATRIINKTAKAVDGLSKSQDVLNTRTATGKATSGVNNAILLETSRLASDASFGLQGMANNIGQIASLFQISAKNSGGFLNAIKDVGRSIMGVGGAMIALQLFISFLPKLVKRFKEAKAAADPVTDAFSNLNEKVDDTSSRFETYISVLQSSTKSDEQKEIAIERLNKEFPDYIKSLRDSNISLNDVKNSTESAAAANDLYRDSIIKLAMSQAAEDKIQELSAEILDKKATRQRELNDLGIKESELKQKAINQDKILVSEFSSDESKKDEISNMNAIKRLHRETEEHNEFIKNKEEQIAVLMDFRILEDNSSKASAALRREFRAGRLSFEKEIIQSENRILDSFIKNKDIQIEIEGDRIKQLAILRQSEFALREQDRVNAIKNTESKAKAQIVADKAISESRESLNAFLLQIDRETDRKINQRRLDNQAETLSLFMKGVEELLVMTEQFGVATAQNDFDRIARQRQLEQQKNQAVITGLRQEKNAALELGNSTLAINQKIFNENERLRQQNALLDKAESEAKLSLANYVGDAIIQIAGEGSAVGKTVAVAMATMNTYEAITAALGAKPYTPFNIAQAAATGAFGFLQVKKILQTKTPAGGGGSAPSGVGGTGDVVAPDFNVVGATGTSTLARVLGEGSRRPTRAYVSMNDVIENNEIIRNIEDTVSL